MSYYFRKCIKLYVLQTRKLSPYLLCGYCFFLGACFYSYFNSLSSRSFLMFKESLFGAQWKVPLLFRKKKISQNDHSKSLVVIRCHLLSFVVTRCHSLSIFAIRCHSLYHSLSLDVSLICLLWTIHFATRNLKITSEIKKRKEQDISNKGSVYQFHLFKEAATTGVFVWTFQNFEEHLFYRTRLGDCFCVYESTTNQFVTSKTSLII